MSIDFKTETVIDVKRQAAQYVGLSRNGRPAHYSFFLRAILKGELEAVRMGRRWVTSVEAIQRWAERQTAGTKAQVSRRTAATRRRAAEQADSELKKRGL
jgi:hypothetical protein